MKTIQIYFNNSLPSSKGLLWVPNYSEKGPEQANFIANLQQQAMIAGRASDEIIQITCDEQCLKQCLKQHGFRPYVYSDVFIHSSDFPQAFTVEYYKGQHYCHMLFKAPICDKQTLENLINQLCEDSINRGYEYRHNKTTTNQEAVHMDVEWFTDCDCDSSILYLDLEKLFFKQMWYSPEQVKISPNDELNPRHEKKSH